MAPPAGRIGPNAITRMAEAITAALGPQRCAEVFQQAGLADSLQRPPEAMVDEQAVTRLHRVACELLGAACARGVGRDAGCRTGAYLLARRIPRPVQSVLRCLPARAASGVLVAAIARHAWTFAGSAHFAARGSGPVVFSLHDCPLCRGARADQPCCDFYAGCFETLFRRLVHPRTRVRETACAATGAAACCFTVRW